MPHRLSGLVNLPDPSIVVRKHRHGIDGLAVGNPGIRDSGNLGIIGRLSVNLPKSDVL